MEKQGLAKIVGNNEEEKIEVFGELSPELKKLSKSELEKHFDEFHKKLTKEYALIGINI